jgi:hypothetical protein
MAWNVTPVSSATWLIWSSTPGMSAVFGIARESLKRSATRIAGWLGVCAPWATAIWVFVFSICCFRVETSDRLGEITRNQPASSPSRTPAASRPNLAGVGSLLIPLIPSPAA